ncbi:beta-propeller domain-containing protein [Candidatus Pacearchaeota archaeon]|nr:beta-propeller domain-containing protein [Candidatus Pacearchaeota archaeon]
MNQKAKSIYIAMLATASIIVILSILSILYLGFKPEPGEGIVSGAKKFNSYSELVSFINSSSSYGGRYYTDSFSVSKATAVTGAASEDSGGGARDYSKTNIQVEGVDEPDIVKNDGKYIYLVSGNKVVIIDAYPAESMKNISEINVSGSIRDIFLNGNKLIVFSQDYEYIPAESSPPAGASLKSIRCIDCGGYSQTRTIISIYDVSDKEDPVVEDEISADGNYLDARMIGDYVYVISQKYVNQNVILPQYSINGVEKTMPIDDVYYFDYFDSNYQFSLVSAININNGDFESKAYLIGNSYTLYVSEDNVYLTGRKSFSYDDYSDRFISDVILKILPSSEKQKVQEIIDSNLQGYEKLKKANKIVVDYSNSLTGKEKEDFDRELMEKTQAFQEVISKELEKTVIHMVSINKMNINYGATGEVPGNVLNQFSMDEHNGNFRIATTSGEVWRGNSANNIYVLDEDLKIIGKIEDIAKGERIYSVRFIGDRGYMVTFKKVDPFFVIDLKNPSEPKILGYLKIPGYSDYLHPYDENHIIGIGKEAIDASDEERMGRDLDFAWYQGVKVALFDVSDVEHPVENAKFVIGDRGTDSYALQDHKAFLFDKKRNLLVLPILLAEIDETKYSGEIPTNAYGEYVWQGAYALNIDENNISLRGRITHADNERSSRNWWSNFNVERSLYMDNVLYTISRGKVKANSLDDVREVNSLTLFQEQEPPVIYYTK